MAGLTLKAPIGAKAFVAMISPCCIILLGLIIGICDSSIEANLIDSPPPPTVVRISETNSNDDLDNSIHKQADVAGNSLSPTTELSDQQTGEGHSWPQKQDGSITGNNNYDNSLPNSIAVINSRAGDPVESLERRLDRLEFELRKWKHQQQQRVAQPTTGSQESATSAGYSEQLEAKWASLASRLELMEKFITTTTEKLYETEQRVKQLEKCECRLGCKWSQPAASGGGGPPIEPTTAAGPSTGSKTTTTTTSADNNKRTNGTNILVVPKLDGQVWESNCDVCSCHRGHVRCSHIACPELQCPDLHHVSGKCCPVCYKPCVYKAQTVRHGNKLVINSNQDTCKECMCIDGRLKCQRVEVARIGAAAPQVAADPNARRQQRSAQFELTSGTATDGWSHYDDPSPDGADYLEEDYSLDALAMEPFEGASGGGAYGGQRRRRTVLAGERAAGSPLHPPLVCPQTDCRPEEQFRLQNDCCTYCRGFDFCAHQRAQHLCHPSAYCLNTAQNESSLADNNLPPPVSAMFRCLCKAGFRGDGRHCADIDECARLDLNDCDLATTTCVNQPGGYQCKCKRGFRPHFEPQIYAGSSAAAELTSSELQQDQQQQNVTSVLVRTATPTSDLDGRGLPQPLVGGARPVRKCADIDECADGKLNRCHPQAKCTNLVGSYKCTCKRGYLGNGIECHKWVSSDPKVAAYLHRHSPHSEARVGALASDDSDSTKARRLPKVQLPLGTLEDPEDDSVDDEQSTARSDPDEDSDVDEEAAAEDSIDVPPQDPSSPSSSSSFSWNAGGLRLSEAKQESLRSHEPTASVSQQIGGTNQQQQSGAMNQGGVSQPNNQQPPAFMDLYQPMASINTRTMFIQPPPPRFWRENVTATTTTTSTITTTTSTTDRPVGTEEANRNEPTTVVAPGNDRHNNSSSNNNGGANYSQSDRNDPVYIQPSSETTVNQHDSRQTRPISEDSVGGVTTQLAGSDGNAFNNTTQQTQKFGIVLPNTNNLGYKRGTIIASAKLVGGRGRQLSVSPSPSTLLESPHNLANSKTNGKHNSHMAAHRSAPSQTTSSAISLLAPPQLIGSQIAEISLVHKLTRHLLHIMPYVILSSLYIYCIHLNHLVAFYFI